MKTLAKSLSLAVGSVLLFALSAHASCGQTGNVCGPVFIWTANGWQYPPMSYNVKVCQTYNPSYCLSTMSSADFPSYTDPPRQSYNFYSWPGSNSEYLYWDLFSWNDSQYYGSSTQPLTRHLISGLGLSNFAAYVPPRAFPPSPVYPANNGSYHAYGNYPVIWNSGMDTARSSFPVTYEVWYKYWPFGGSEPASYTLAAGNLPCHADGSGPDANNQCNTMVVDPGAIGNWRWKVVANLDVSVVLTGMPQTIYKTESSSAYFTWIP